MSFDNDLQQTINSIGKSISDNEKLFTPVLASKLAGCLKARPQDQTFGAMSRVIEGLVEHNTLFISRAELKSLYGKLYSRGTAFGDEFSEELGETPYQPEITLAKSDNSTFSAPPAGDQVLANALESVFDPSIPLKQYSQVIANKALKSVASTLGIWNLSPAKLSVSDGNQKFLIIQADYETPKGLTSFYVPVETTKNEVSDPEIFIGTTLGPQELNNKEIKAYLTQYAGTKMKVAGSQLLSLLTTSATEKREVSDAELAVIRFNASRTDQADFFQGQVVGLTVEASGKPDVQSPKLDDIFSFEKNFTSPQGLASWQFGDKVSIARNAIVRQLQSFGYSNPQVVVQKSDTDTIFYGVSLDTGKVAFTVPVKITGGIVSQPSFMLCNGSIADFSRDGINTMVSQNKTDVKVASVASAMASLKPSEIIDGLRIAIAEGNIAKAEDALNVLANSGDMKAHATAFQLYMTAMASASLPKLEETKCSKQIKSSVSEHPICSHTGLPTHKVYQDKFGNCLPLYRRGMDETYEGATFLNAKVFG